MPTVILDIPNNSKFDSSLNEIDLAMKQILLKEMRLADPRDRLGKINSQGKNDNWYWTDDSVFQVDELTIENIFDTWLLRNSKKLVDVQYPLLAFKQEDINTVFWGTGNRYNQWELTIPTAYDTYQVGDEVIIKFPFKYRGYHAEIAEIFPTKNNCTLLLNGTLIKDLNKKPVYFNLENLVQTGTKQSSVYKAKPITGTYHAVILVSNRDEAQYIRDKFILRCSDANIWFKYSSPTLNGAENQIFTVFEIPNLEMYPTNTDKLKGKGYIYGVGFVINIWAALTDTPLPSSVIEAIRLNLQVDREDHINRIVIN